MIELKNIVKKIDDKVILDNINLSIPKGTAYGLLGSNGAGKSTILRLLCGIYQQESGELTIDGQKVFNNNSIKERIFFINDETIQFTSYTLKSLKDFYKKFYPEFSEELFEKLRNQVNLPLDKKLSKFSKGMKRQAVVITALACRTDYLFLDEAFDGLDPSMRIIVKRMIVDAMIDRELTTIISSHNLKEIGEVCDSAALVHQGKIIFSSGIDEIQSNVHKIQAVFTGDKKYKKEDFRDIQILHIENSGSVYRIIAKGSEAEVKRIINAENPTLIEIIPLTLEEIFVYEMEGLGYGYKEN
jgi:ABC-2 type transport system ATP-binding protein